MFPRGRSSLLWPRCRALVVVPWVPPPALAALLTFPAQPPSNNIETTSSNNNPLGAITWPQDIKHSVELQPVGFRRRPRDREILPTAANWGTSQPPRSL